MRYYSIRLLLPTSVNAILPWPFLILLLWYPLGVVSKTTCFERKIDHSFGLKTDSTSLNFDFEFGETKKIFFPKHGNIFEKKYTQFITCKNGIIVEC